MKLISHIGKRFAKSQKDSFSKPVIRIAISGISISIAVMIISVIIVKGFQLEIKNKVIGFNGHIILRTYQLNNSDDQKPIEYDRADVKSLSNIDGVISINPTAEKTGILKTDNQIEGCIFKGVNENYYDQFISNSVIKGNFPKINKKKAINDVLISKITANRLNINVGDDIRMYFLLPGEQQPRGRKFKVSGIYETGFSEFDKILMFGDIKHIQSLNRWNNNHSGKIEITINNYNNIDNTIIQASQKLDYDIEINDVRNIYPEIFNWLKLLDMNVNVIIIVMLIVALINIITILLIRVLEKTSAIGILKSIGATNNQIRMIFLYSSATILLKGMIIGNFIGISLGLIQKHFSIMKLNQDTYYTSTVPIFFNLGDILIINILVFLCGVVVMLIPSIIISRIYPAKTLRIK